jgi:sigma-B regulation protein RsbU (phosphoserine phosphatase)
LEDILRARGHDLHIQEGHEGALAELAAAPFGLVVVDLTADRERGLELCRRLRELPDGGWSVLLVVTPSNQPQQVEEALHAGADDYLFCEDPASVWGIRLAIAEHRFADKQGRRAMLRELSRTESRFQELLETAPDAILGCDADGRISLMNEQAVRLTGYDRAELRGLSIEALVPGPLRQAHAEHRRRFFQRPAARPMGTGIDLRLRRKDGGEIDVDICLGYHREGDRLYAIAAIRDITERRRMQEELRLAKEATERAYERIHREVEAAARVQQALLPTCLPRPERARFAYQYHPCAELAGDGLNVFWLDENNIGLYILDVSGHGVAAALLSVALARLLSPAFGPPSSLRAPVASVTDAPRLAQPAEVARGLNEWFLAKPTAEQFFTMIYGVLELPSLRLRYASAGHPSLLLTHADRAPEWLPSTGPPIGIIGDAAFEEKVVTLQPGDRALLYSDGVTEAHNPSGEMFGAARLYRAVVGATAMPLEALLQGLREEVLAWSHGRANDDLSLLALEVQGPIL